MSKTKSFIFHLDTLEIIKEMSNEQAGVFIKSVLAWHESEQLPEIDFTMKMALSGFIAQFKRDRENRNDASQSGKIGNLKKWHKEIFLRYENKEITLEQALDEAAKNKGASGASRGESGGDRGESLSRVEKSKVNPPIASGAIGGDGLKIFEGGIGEFLTLLKEETTKELKQKALDLNLDWLFMCGQYISKLKRDGLPYSIDKAFEAWCEVYFENKRVK